MLLPDDDVVVVVVVVLLLLAPAPPLLAAAADELPPVAAPVAVAELVEFEDVVPPKALATFSDANLKIKKLINCKFVIITNIGI